MSSKQVYFAMLGLLALLFAGLILGTYGANKYLVSQAQTLTNLKAKNAALGQEQVIFSKAKTDVAKYSDLSKIAKTAVPQDKDQAEGVQEIVNIAAQNKVTLASISFPASSLGGAASTSTSTTTPAPAAANSKANVLSQLVPVKNIPGVYSLEIAITSDNDHPITYAQFVNFLAALEQNRRTSQVSSITISPVTDNRAELNFTLSLQEYIKP